MSHYAIVKRHEMKYIPSWCERLKQYQHTNINIIQYEECTAEYLSMWYTNVIIDKVIDEELLVYWEGEVNQDILKVGERIVINDESFEILKVEKHINGNVTYQVESKLIKAENYEKEMVRAKGHYDDYSKQLQERKRLNNIQLKEKESWIKSMFRDLFLNNKSTLR